MMFILIMSTLGRTDDLVRFFESLTQQSDTSFKIFLCDQNDDDRLLPIIGVWKDRFAIQVVRSGRGLSRGRNAAIAAALAELDSRNDYIVAFPDDDCWYAPDVLEKVTQYLSASPTLAGVTGRSKNEKGLPSAGSSPEVPTDLNPGNLFRGSMGISYCIFLRSEVLRMVGLFDESLGVGAGTKWGAGEESDYLLRALRKGAHLRYEPSIEIFHPDKDLVLNGERFLAYSRGHGRILRLNGYSWAAICKDIFVALAAFFIKSLLQRRIMYPYLYRALGYLQGYSATDPRPNTLLEGPYVLK